MTPPRQIHTVYGYVVSYRQGAVSHGQGYSLVSSVLSQATVDALTISSGEPAMTCGHTTPSLYDTHWVRMVCLTGRGACAYSL